MLGNSVVVTPVAEIQTCSVGQPNLHSTVNVEKALYLPTCSVSPVIKRV